MSKTVFTEPNARNFQKMTPENYLKMERKGVRESDGKYELLNQTLLYVANVSEHHICIAGNILTILKNVIWQNDLKSHVFQSEMRVGSTSNFFYPDVVFVKEKTIYTDEKKDVLINPTLLIEVLSDETESFDRTDKFESYKQIESLQEYILVSQYERYVEHRYRNSDGEWIKIKVYKNGVLPLLSIPYSLPLKQIYDGMPF